MLCDRRKKNVNRMTKHALPIIFDKSKVTYEMQSKYGKPNTTITIII